MKVVLIDLSSLAYPIWHMSQSEPNPNHSSEQIVARVRALASNQPHVAICVDSGKSFRAEIDPDYKGNRVERDERLHHQIKLAVQTLTGDGFPIWSEAGFEADDLIATGTRLALERPDVEVEIFSADKDLLQLVGDRVHAVSMKDGSVVDAAAVKEKFGVSPAQMRDYLSIVGDAADNIKGIKGLGPKSAVKLLETFGSLDELYRLLDDDEARKSLRLSAAAMAALEEFRPRMKTVTTLITLRTDAGVNLDTVLTPRQSLPAEENAPHPFAAATYDDDAEEVPLQPPPVTTVEPIEAAAGTAEAPPKRAIAVREPGGTGLEVPWERQLDPRSLKQAQALAFDMWKSGMFSSYGTPEAVLSTGLVGRELGIPFMTALRTIHNIKGRHALSAQLIVALVLRSGLAEYFEAAELTDASCTYVTKRKGGRGEIAVTHTLEMAKQAELVKPDSGWVKNPQDMLAARASARLARLVYPDICANVYTPEEIAEMAVRS